MPRKKRTTSSDKGAFLYRTSRDRLDLIEEEAERKGISPKVMLDLIVDAWYSGETRDKKRKPKKVVPWYMEKKDD